MNKYYLKKSDQAFPWKYIGNQATYTCINALPLALSWAVNELRQHLHKTQVLNQTQMRCLQTM